MSFAAPIFTAAGRALQVRALAGEQLKFTKIGIGDGELAGSVEGLTTLINSIVDVDLSFESRDEKVYTVGGAFTNADITTGFYWREIGLYAADPDYPDDRSKDILYAYQNAFTLAEYIASGSSSIIEKNIRIAAVVGNAPNVVAEINTSTVFITQKEFQEALSNVPKLFHTEAQPVANGPWIWMQAIRTREISTETETILLLLSDEEPQNGDVIMQINGIEYTVDNASTNPEDVGEGEYLFDINN